jgi:hypothetical protein
VRALPAHPQDEDAARAAQTRGGEGPIDATEGLRARRPAVPLLELRPPLTEEAELEVGGRQRRWRAVARPVSEGVKVGAVLSSRGGMSGFQAIWVRYIRGHSSLSPAATITAPSGANRIVSISPTPKAIKPNATGKATTT